MLKEGWLKRQLENAEKDIESWPDWMKRLLDERLAQEDASIDYDNVEETPLPQHSE